MEELCNLINIKLVSFEQFTQNSMPEDNKSDADCLKKFETYIYLGLS